MRYLIRTCAAGILCVMLPALAHAHAHLKSSSPADKATLAASPPAITLEFSEEIELKVSKATVTGPGNEAVKTGEATHGKGGGSIVEIPLNGPLPAGTYTVVWRVLSKDGHKVKGSSTFSIKP